MAFDSQTAANTSAVNDRPAWHTLPPEFAAARLESDAERGLTAEEAARRLSFYGPNRREPLPEPRAMLLQLAGAELLRPGVLLLAALAVLLLATSSPIQALLAVSAALALLLARLAYRLRVQRTLAQLQTLQQRPAVVRRAGIRRQIPADEVVPGDLILLEHGRLVPAEARLVSATSLQVCYPQAGTRRARLDKTTDAVLDAETPPEERSTMVHPGMLVCRGLGQAVVVATGSQAVRLRGLEPLPAAATLSNTAVQRIFNHQARWLIVVVLTASLLLPAAAWWRGQLDGWGALAEALALAFALLPLEGAGIVALLLALGAERLAERRAVPRDLQAVETLSAVSAILSSKTGLLTDGQMTLQRCVPAAWNRQLMEIALMTTIAEVEPSFDDQLQEPQLEIVHDSPQEAALLRAAQQAGLDVAGLRANRPVEAVFQVDPLRRRSSVVYRRGARHWVSVRGAPDAVLDVCTRRWTADGIDHLTEVDRQAIIETAAVLAEGGGRVIALAERSLPPEEARRNISPASIERELNFAGLLALTDNLRPESARSVRQCRQAGIQVLLVTGDHPVAARAVGLQSSLAQAGVEVQTGQNLYNQPTDELQAALYGQRVVARSNPRHKLQVLEALQKGGACVAVTGLYLMEAPLLAAADLGVTRENASSDAAHLAADLKLVDGRFSTLVGAIARGRWIFSNLSKTLSLYLAGQLGLLVAVSLPVLLGVPLPLSAPMLALIGLNLAAAVPLLYVSEPPEDILMQHPPRDPAHGPFRPLMMARLLRGALGLFMVLTMAYFGSLLGIGELPRARMLAFVTWMLMLVLTAYSLRSDSRGLLRQNIFSNRPLFVWSSIVVVLVVALASIPAAAGWIGGGVLGIVEWGFCLLALLAGLVFVEVRKWAAGLGRRR